MNFVAVGELAERLKAHAWKACLLARVTRVRIPHSPQNLPFSNKFSIFFLFLGFLIFLKFLITNKKNYAKITCILRCFPDDGIRECS